MKRQPPIALIYIFVQAAGKLLRILWPVILLSIFGKENANRGDKWLWITIIISFITLISAVINYLFFRYRVSEEHLLINKGLFSKKAISIPLQNIQAVNIAQSWLHRLTGVSEVVIDSPGTAGRDAKILMTYPEALRFKEGLLQFRPVDEVGSGAVQAPAAAVYRLSATDLLKLVISENHLRSLILLMGLLAGLFQNIQEYFNNYYNQTYAEVQSLLLQNTMVMFGWLLIAAFFISLVVSAIRVVARYANFEISSHEKGIYIHKGLINRDQQLVPSEKVQFMRWTANALRKKLKMYEFRIFSIGAEEAHKDMRVDIPVTNPGLLQWLIHRFTDSFSNTNASSIRILPFYFSRKLILFSLLTLLSVAAALWLNMYLLVLIPFFAYGIFSAWYVVKNFCLQYNDEILYLQRGSFGSDDILLKWVNIQYVEIRQSLFQQRRGIATIRLHTAGGAVTIPFIHLHEARKLCDLSLYKMETGEWNLRKPAMPIGAERQFLQEP